MMYPEQDFQFRTFPRNFFSCRERFNSEDLPHASYRDNEYRYDRAGKSHPDRDPSGHFRFRGICAKKISLNRNIMRTDQIR